VTGCNGTGHVISYVLYVEDTAVNEDMLFCKHIKKNKNRRTLENC
jgi:hypothetical protein